MTKAEEIYHRFVQYEWNEIGEGMKKSILDAINEALRQPPVSGSLPPVHDVIESRIKHFESIYHTYEANELKQALSTIQRLVPPIMFEIGGGNDH